MATSGKVQRYGMLTFINTTPKEDTSKYALLGYGITESSIAYNPQTEEETYIHESSASTEVTGYQPTMSVTAQVYKGDEAFEFLDNLRLRRAILIDAQTDIVNVYLYMDGTINAERQTVSCQFDDFGGAGGESLSFSYTLNFKGDPDLGAWDAEERSFKFVEAVSGSTGLSSSLVVPRVQDVIADHKSAAPKFR